MIEGYMTSKQAAEYLKRSDALIRKLCKAGKLAGATKAGNTWLIPEKTIKTYTPGPKGFAYMWQRIKEEYEQGNIH